MTAHHIFTYTHITEGEREKDVGIFLDENRVHVLHFILKIKTIFFMKSNLYC